MSITLPCYDQTGNFIGVAETDINLEDLLSEITFFNQDQTTYAFMIAKTGRTLIYPLLAMINKMIKMIMHFLTINANK